MLRRRLASFALALIAVQMAFVFTAPLSACCPSRAAHARVAADAGKDCCPAGAHEPGQCPLHARSRSVSKVSCRMQCDAPHGLQFLVGAIGVLAPPAAVPVALASERVASPAPRIPVLRSSIPDSPPPRLL